jgi:alpha-glucuronidase
MTLALMFLAMACLGASVSPPPPPPLPSPPYSMMWLSFTPISATARAAYNIKRLNCTAPQGTLLGVACSELRQGLSAMLQVNLNSSRSGAPASDYYTVQVVVTDRASPQGPQPAWPPDPRAESFSISADPAARTVTIASPSEHGALHGAWRLLALVQQEAASLDVSGSVPNAPLRMLDFWDNLDGSIERGYAGSSVLYPLGRVDPARVVDLARLVSSLGLNAVVLNNVNACGNDNQNMLASANLALLVPTVAALYMHGIHVLVTPCWTAPQTVGGLNSSDPRDAAVTAWWTAKLQEMAAKFGPAFRGLLFKGDTEGQPGPNLYNMTELQGANYFAALVQQTVQGMVIWRAFAHPPNGKTMPVDQALFQFQRFAGWDGAAAANVALQIKNGPYDFQVREPVHALFGRLARTSLILEVEITPEYLGQNRHAVTLLPMWSSYLSFDLGSVSGGGNGSNGSGGGGGDTTLAGVIGRGAFSGVAGVANFGNAANWTGLVLNSVNMLGFGRLAWEPELPAPAIMSEWAALCFPGSAPGATADLVSLLGTSWPMYENVTASLGWGMVSAYDHYHMDPGLRTDYTNASKTRIGYNRGQPDAYGACYNGDVAAAFLSLDRCPEELLLSFWNVDYNHTLRGAQYGGRTVLQWILESHASGAATSASYPRQWAALADRLNLSVWAVGGEPEESVFQQVASVLATGAADAAIFAQTIIEYFQKIILP